MSRIVDIPPLWKGYVFLVSMPLTALAMNLAFFGERVWSDPLIWKISMPLSALIGLLAWVLQHLHESYLEKRFPNFEDSPKRVCFKLLAIFVTTPIGVLIGLWIYDQLAVLDFTWQSIHTWEALGIGLGTQLVTSTLCEGRYILTKYHENTLEREMMSQVSVTQELDALKNQINPHFLFNCFNTLSSLITVDKVKAEAFLNELSKVYRYMLRNNTEGVSTLSTEIQFIESYYQLLQTRHGEALRLHMHINPRYESYLLPSLSLQLLVENAVKHNMLSKNNPLIIDIFTTTGAKLVVNNNLQRRVIKALSAKVGLENIRSKYHLLKQSGFQVMEDEKNYTVVLPLIWKH
jgi:two-component system, LytTR family, sensor kinase